MYLLHTITHSHPHTHTPTNTYKHTHTNTLIDSDEYSIVLLCKNATIMKLTFLFEH